RDHLRGSVAGRSRSSGPPSGKRGRTKPLVDPTCAETFAHLRWFGTTFRVVHRDERAALRRRTAELEARRRHSHRSLTDTPSTGTPDETRRTRSGQDDAPSGGVVAS